MTTTRGTGSARAATPRGPPSRRDEQRDTHKHTNPQPHKPTDTRTHKTTNAQNHKTANTQTPEHTKPQPHERTHTHKHARAAGRPNSHMRNARGLGWWIVHTTVRPVRAVSRSVRTTASAMDESRPDVGSSRRSTDGSCGSEKRARSERERKARSRARTDDGGGGDSTRLAERHRSAARRDGSSHARAAARRHSRRATRTERSGDGGGAEWGRSGNGQGRPHRDEL